MNRKILVIAALMGGLSVILGAFGAHALKEMISLEAQATFETGVRYQMYHALLLLFVGQIDNLNSKTKKVVLWMVAVGVLCFSGSIYGLSTNELTGFDFKKIALITPLGGVLLITAWAILLITFLKEGADKSQF